MHSRSLRNRPEQRRKLLMFRSCCYLHVPDEDRKVHMKMPAQHSPCRQYETALPTSSDRSLPRWVASQSLSAEECPREAYNPQDGETDTKELNQPPTEQERQSYGIQPVLASPPRRCAAWGHKLRPGWSRCMKAFTLTPLSWAGLPTCIWPICLDPCVLLLLQLQLYTPA